MIMINLLTGGWVWDDRTPVDYVNWANGEPNGAENGENCAEMYDDEYGKWNDEDCLNNAGYVCVMSQCKENKFLIIHLYTPHMHIFKLCVMCIKNVECTPRTVLGAF